MKSRNIKTGRAYAFYRGKLTEDSHVRPALVLSLDKYENDGGVIRPAGKDAQLSPGRFLEEPAVGLLAVEVRGAKNIPRVLETASVEEFAPQRELLDPATGTVIGRYALITSVFCLHGDYAEVQARLEKARKFRDEVAAAQDAFHAENARRKAGLAARLEELGIRYRRISDESSSEMTLHLEEMGKLIAMAAAGPGAAGTRGRTP